MVNIESHVSEIQRREYEGEDDGRVAAAALNGEAIPVGLGQSKLSKAALRRMTEIVELLHQMSSYAKTPGAVTLLNVKSFRGKKHDHFFFERLEEMNSYLMRYRNVPFCGQSLKTGALRIEWVPDLKFASSVENAALRAVLRLVDAGQIEQLARCGACCRWMFARFSHQKFCSAKCRERHFRSSPEWKEHRRRKARENYWRQKARENHWLEQSRKMK